jgi:hypothetical protein
VKAIRVHILSIEQKKIVPQTRAPGFGPCPPIRPAILGLSQNPGSVITQCLSAMNPAPVAAGPTPWILDFCRAQPGFNPGPMITQAAFGAHGRDTAEGAAGREATPQEVPGPSSTPGPAPGPLPGSMVRKPLFVVAPPAPSNAVVPPLSAALQVPVPSVPTVSVADPGCLSRIPDPDPYLSRIPGLGSRVSDPGSRMHQKFLLFLPYCIVINIIKL